MAQNPINKIKLSKTQLWLVAILLGFVLLLFLIWLWYSLELTKIDKELKSTKPTAIINNQSITKRIIN